MEIYDNTGKVEKYVSGRMDNEETLGFEKEIASDSALKSEIEFQQRVISGIRKYRKLELKNRLANLKPAPPALVESVQLFAVTHVKSLVAVSLFAVTVSLGAYFYFKSEDTTVVDNPNLLEEIVPDESLYSSDTVSFFEEEKITTPTNERDKIGEGKVANDKIELKKEETTIVTTPIKKDKIKPFATLPDFGVTASMDSLSADNLQLDEVDEMPLSNNTKTTVKVHFHSSNTRNIKYMFYEGKLFLDGAFKENNPYQIIELNNKSGRKVYLNYLNSFYQLATTKFYLPLIKVEDKNILKELKLHIK